MDRRRLVTALLFVTLAGLSPGLASFESVTQLGTRPHRHRGECDGGLRESDRE
jgi:hypothetical protein